MKARKFVDEVGLREDSFKALQKFSIRKMYALLRGDFQKVTWRRLVCNNFGAPRWISFLGWQHMKGYKTRGPILYVQM